MRSSQELLHDELLELASADSTVRFCNQKQDSAGLEHPQSLPQVVRQTWPVIMSLHRGDQIKPVCWKRQCRYGGEQHPDATRIDQRLVGRNRGSDASWRVIDTHYRTCRCGLRQLVDGSPPAAPHIEDGE